MVVLESEPDVVYRRRECLGTERAVLAAVEDLYLCLRLEANVHGKCIAGIAVDVNRRVGGRIGQTAPPTITTVKRDAAFRSCGGRGLGVDGLR